MKAPFDQWTRAKEQWHNIRDMDRDTIPFRCFTCSSWFDGQQQLDRNYNHIAVEIQICPIAQQDVFDP
jgi:hypothetical protein